MGCNNSKIDDSGEGESEQWRTVLSTEDARKKYEADGTLPPNSPSGLLELRGFLDDPMLMKHVGMFGKTRKSFDAFMCWVDIQEFKSITSKAQNFRRSKSHHIYQKYLKPNAGLRLKTVNGKLISNVIETLDLLKEERMDLPNEVFNELQQECLRCIYKDIFVAFKSSDTYAMISKTIHTQYNQIKPDDFEYIEVLGEGGFGLVVHCIKTSTKKHYALKLQTKAGLVKSCKHHPARIDFEKQALAACNHPFIVAMDYAFQSRTLVFLAMQLGSGGTLHDAVMQCPNKRMPEDRVIFYAAEIALALAHIHGLGMIYRDLKPQNVLLNADGHIQLVDLGGIIDPGGHVLGAEGEADNMLSGGLFVKDFHSIADDSTVRSQQTIKQKDPDFESDPASCNIRSAPVPENIAKGSERGVSVMGTDGYMAIEMLVMKRQPQEERKGYTNAVDWWSLGATMFVLLSSRKPYFFDDTTLTVVSESVLRNPKMKNGIEALLESLSNWKHLPDIYREAFEKLDAVGSAEVPGEPISLNTIGLILELLDVNEYTRLGARYNGGVNKLKMHPAFKFNLKVEKAINTKPAGSLQKDPVSVSVTVPNNAPAKPKYAKVMKRLSAEKDGKSVSVSLKMASFSVSHSVKARNMSINSSEPSVTVSSGHNNPPIPPEVQDVWDLFEAKQIVPPFMPKRVPLQEVAPFENFDEFMVSLDKLDWLKENAHTLVGDDVPQFANWDFVSPNILKMECGIANVMVQYQKNYKARQLLGPR